MSRLRSVSTVNEKSRHIPQRAPRRYNALNEWRPSDTLMLTVPTPNGIQLTEWPGATCDSAQSYARSEFQIGGIALGGDNTMPGSEIELRHAFLRTPVP